MKQNAKRRRRAAGIMTGVLAAAILLSGTFAWQSLSQFAINNADGEPDPAGARLHDDFEDNQEWTLGANKDVYVENYSGQNPNDPLDEGQPVYVRVKLAEYMEIGEGAGKFGIPTRAGDPVDYQDLDQADVVGAARTADPDNHAVSLVSGASILNPSTWTTHIPYGQASVSNGPFNTYWDWEMGGSKAFMPTFNKNNISLLTDRTVYKQDEFVSGTDTKTDNATYWDKATSATTTQSETHNAKDTLDTAGVLTMVQWKSIGSPVMNASGDGYWVGDTDGWFYWSDALAPGESTGLLLDGFTLSQEPSDAWYYGVHVTAQMVTAGDWGEKAQSTVFYQDGLSDDALQLLLKASKRIPTITAINILEGSQVYVKAGNPVTLHAVVNLKHPSGDPSESAVTWSISPQAAGFDATTGTLTTQAGDPPTTYTITAESAALPQSMSASTTIVVTPTIAADGAVDGVTIPRSKLGDTADWLTIAGKDVGGQPYYLIVRKTVSGTSSFPNSSNYVGSNVQTAMTNFYSGIAATADDYVVNSDADTVRGRYENITDPISTPMQGSTKAFALSFQEAAKYLSTSWHKYTTSQYITSSATAQSNWAMLNDETTTNSWLRTRQSASYESQLDSSGKVWNWTSTSTRQVRPAMWVRADIFLP